MVEKFKRGEFEKQIGNLPSEVKYCKKCVMSNQRPRIIFNKDGVCSACLNTVNYKDKVNWSDRERQLNELLSKHRRSDGSYDVIVPSSGGKDSALVAHQLKYKYGMNPLTVTWAPLRYTDIGFKNYQSLCDSGIPNFLYMPNGIVHRKLARLCFEELGDAFHIFVLGQSFFPFHMALKHNISLVMYGENGEAEYAGNPELVDSPFVSFEKWNSAFHKGSKLDELIKYGTDNKDYMNEDDFSYSDLEYYTPPSIDKLKDLEVKGMHYFGFYKKWSPQESFYYASEHTGFQASNERSEGTYTKYASLDDKLDDMHYFMKYIKFGFGRTTDDASHEVRDNHINREEAVALVKRYDGEKPSRYFSDFLRYLDINEEQFWSVADSYRLKHIWKKNGSEWTLKNPVWDSE
jgi:N-acetyl sugar amidotransferase